ncbi:MAG TPA: SDR family oxidoreductase [Candidatus Methylacidiphilales bacterium]|nr:SDR family oxidoreductase [Candidatus Methylacidiphilales bacterium]
MKTHTALITGASSGIGLHLAREFARHGHPLVLVAPRQDELVKVASEIEADFGVKALVIARDLQNPDAPLEIAGLLAEKDVVVSILVNNAGFGIRGNSWDINIEQDLAMVKLNIEAPLRLTKIFLHSMLAKDCGWILNTASVAGFMPGPLLNVYHSTKAFVLSWSQGLASELKDTSIKVTALCPGATDTDFFTKAGMEDAKGFQGSNVMAPQDVAKAGYEGLMSGETIVVPGVMNKAMVEMRRILTQSTMTEMSKSNYEPTAPDDKNRKRGDVEQQAELADQTISHR